MNDIIKKENNKYNNYNCLCISNLYLLYLLFPFWVN